MSRQRNQNDGNLKDVLRRLYRLERQSMLAHSSIGREGLEVYDGGWIRILNGGLQVIGTATISGVLDVTGTTNLQGQTSVTGPMEISGTTNITGNTNILGELNVTGPTTLDGITEIGGQTTVAADFEITTGGLFKSGLTTIEPTGKAIFGDFVIDPSSNKLIDSPAGWLFTTGPDSIGLASSDTSSVNLNGVYAELNFGGSSVVRASEGRVDLNTPKAWINGEVEASGNANWRGLSYFHSATRFNHATLIFAALPTTASPANLHVDPSTGRVYRSTV